ncbi:hypothetical protein P154DRAFT_260220 [Amniculicola lignicola CBS 123094]|uniref:Mid2 domain-containing protein n=1 Tax=Amniculicola lignicola CBS 123094 TaxID=1392246 RepID=A0A6A5WKQ8_9PLEO|nr:hypothetical protein P154DRAFT_260220 [Amniculicola lignicola CBS 123094]
MGLFLPRLLLLFIIILVLLDLSVSDCFFPNGDQASDHEPCNTNSSLPLSTICCNAFDTCRENGLCMFQDTFNGKERYNFYRGSCTEQDWNSGKCLNICTSDGDAPASIPLRQCDSPRYASIWCCGDNLKCCPDRGGSGGPILSKLFRWDPLLSSATFSSPTTSSSSTISYSSTTYYPSTTSDSSTTSSSHTTSYSPSSSKTTLSSSPPASVNQIASPQIPISTSGISGTATPSTSTTFHENTDRPYNGSNRTSHLQFGLGLGLGLGIPLALTMGALLWLLLRKRAANKRTTSGTSLSGARFSSTLPELASTTHNSWVVGGGDIQGDPETRQGIAKEEVAELPGFTHEPAFEVE